MRTCYKKIIPACIFLFAIRCAPIRRPVPVGEIPQSKAPTIEDEQIGHQTFGELTQQYPLDYDHPRFNELQEVVEKLTSSINANSQPWHVYLLKDPKTKNAGATRGNHIFVWTGMLDYTKDKNELAAVLGHEISHVLAGHTDPDPNESIRKLLISVGSMAAGIAAATASGYSDAGQITSQITNTVGEGFFINPYSQAKENEADQIGIFLMAKAGFNPEAAVQFWERASRDPSFSSGPSFFSTHPDSAERMMRLKQLLPQALKYYRGQPYSDKPSNNYENNSSRRYKKPQNLPKFPPQDNKRYSNDRRSDDPESNDRGSNDSWDTRGNGDIRDARH